MKQRRADAKYTFRMALKCAICRQQISIGDLSFGIFEDPCFIKKIIQGRCKTYWGDQRLLDIARRIKHPEDDVFADF